MQNNIPEAATPGEPESDSHPSTKRGSWGGALLLGGSALVMALGGFLGGCVAFYPAHSAYTWYLERDIAGNYKLSAQAILEAAVEAGTTNKADITKRKVEKLDLALKAHLHTLELKKGGTARWMAIKPLGPFSRALGKAAYSDDPIPLEGTWSVDYRVGKPVEITFITSLENLLLNIREKFRDRNTSIRDRVAGKTGIEDQFFEDWEARIETLRNEYRDEVRIIFHLTQKPEQIQLTRLIMTEKTGKENVNYIFGQGTFGATIIYAKEK
jgi:hypothetical protein